MLLFLAKKYCRGRYPLVELANTLGLTVNSFGSNTYKFKKIMSGNIDLTKKNKLLNKLIGNVKYEN